MPSGIYIKKEGVIYGNKGKKASPEKLKKLSESHIGQIPWNKGMRTRPIKIKLSKEQRSEIGRINASKRIDTNKGKTWKLSGEKLENLRKAAFKRRGAGSYNYKHDRSLVTKRTKSDINMIEYRQWRNFIFNRDGYKCKISNNECKGQLEAHHILTWKDYPELRYDVNNGICLCHHHHPRKKVDVDRLVTKFKQLIK